MNENVMKLEAPQAKATQTATLPNKPEQKQPDKREYKSRRLVQKQQTPILRFSPTAWAKLLFFRDRQETEIGGFGVTSASNLLKVEEFITVKQEVTLASVSFDDQAVADFFEAQVDAGRKPEQFARIWLHTHPGDSPHPSVTDEETFARVFGACQWAVMFVLARGGKSYARLRFNVGPGGCVILPVDVDFEAPFGPSQHEVWKEEYKANINADSFSSGPLIHEEFSQHSILVRHSVPGNWLEELEAMEPAERRLILDELAARPDLWEGDKEIFYD
jgi:proteasome lid subunit RPN8/RPN11